MRYEGCFHNGSNEEHEQHPSKRGPDHEKSMSHSVCFLLLTPKKCSREESLCQLFSATNLSLILFKVKALARSRTFVRASTRLSLAFGSAKLAVPTCTAEAPTERYSSTSSAVSIPPRPIIGDRIVFRVSHTSLKVMGLMAGPERPPVGHPSRDWPVRKSRAIAG